MLADQGKAFFQRVSIIIDEQKVAKIAHDFASKFIINDIILVFEKLMYGSLQLLSNTVSSKINTPSLSLINPFVLRQISDSFSVIVFNQ